MTWPVGLPRDLAFGVENCLKMKLQLCSIRALYFGVRPGAI